MKAISAQTHACDPQTEGTPDNAKEIENSTPIETSDITVPVILAAPNPLPSSPAATDPGALAARILQLNAANDAALPQRAKQPELLWQDDSPMEMPAVLTSDPAGDWFPNNGQKKRSQDRQARYGPSFKALFASTVLLAAAGTGAIALGLPDMMREQAPDVRIVKTETITAVPKDDRIPTSGAIRVPVPPQTANPKQIEKAKDRIRQAFVETVPQQIEQARSSQTPESISSSAPLAGVEPGEKAPASSSVPGIQAAGLKTTSTGQPRQTSQAATLRETPQSSVPLADRADRADSQQFSAKAPVSTTTDKPDGSPTTGLIGETQKTGTITASVNLRQTDKKNGRIIAIVPQGTDVPYQNCGKWWCEVTYEGKTGFVGQKFVNR